MPVSPIRFAARFFAGCITFWLICLFAQAAAPEPSALTPLVTFKGHQEPVYSVAISPDGKLIATGSFDKSVRLWDAKTGKEVRSFSGTVGHQNFVLSVAFSPGGDSIASGGSDNTARVWDVPVNTPTAEFVHAAGVNAVAVSPDGKLIAGACKNGSIALWTSDGKSAGNLVGHPGGATSLAFRADGKTLVSGGADQTICFWNPTNGQQLGRVGAHTSAVTGVAFLPNAAVSVGEDGFLKWWQMPPVASKTLVSHGDAVTAFYLSPDGNSIVSASADKVVKFTNFSNGQLVKEFKPDSQAKEFPVMNSLTMAPNSTTIVGGGADGKLYFWKSDDGKLFASLPAYAGGVTGLSFNPKAPILATVGADGLMRTWSFPVNATRSIATPDRILAAALSADAKRLFTAGPDKIIRSWTFATGAMERQFSSHTGAVTALAVTADGNTLISASADETIRFWNVTNSTQSAQLSGHTGAIASLSVNAQGNLLVSGGEDGTVKVWQLPPTAAKPFAHPDSVSAMSLAGDGSRLLTIGNDKQVRIWNTAGGQIERNYTAGSGAVSSAVFAADSNIVAIAGADKSLVLWNNGKETKKFAPLPTIAQALAFAPNGVTMAAGLGDNSIRLLNVADGKEIKNINGHTGPITALSYSPKGDLLISASADKTLRLWNATDGSAKGQFTHTGPIAALALGKDGNRVAVGGPDKKISMWTLADGIPAGTIATPAEVRGLSLSPDGQKIAVAGSDGKVRIYGIDGKLQESFSHDGPATGIAFMPDGKRVVSSSNDRTARIWTWAFVAQGSHAGPVRQVIVSPQGDRIFSVGDNKQLRIWDAKTGKEIKAIAAHDSAIVGLAFSADSAKAVTIGADKMAKVWNLSDGKSLAAIALPGPAKSVAFSPNGLRIAVACSDRGNRICTYDAVSGKELQTIAEGRSAVSSLFFLGDNRTLVAAGEKDVNVYDAAVQSVSPIHPGGATGIVYHSNGTQVFTAGKDKLVRYFDVATEKDVKAFGPLADPINALALSRDFNLVGAAAGKVVKIWQVADAKEIATLVHPAEVIALAFNSDKSRIVTGASDNLARVWDAASGRLLQSYSQGGAVRGVAFHPTLPLVIAASADKTVAVHGQTINKMVAASPAPLRAVAVTSNGSHVITGGDDKNVKLWDAGSGADARTFSGAEGPIHAVAVPKNAQHVAAAGADKTIRLYNFNDGKLIGAIPAPAVVRGLAFHPTLPILSSACDDNSVIAWNIAYQPGQPLPPEFGKPIQAFAHSEPATAVVFSDQKSLFSASADKTVKQWRIASDAPVRNFQHPNLVDSVAFDPAGKLLATGCHDGRLRIYDVEKTAAIKTIDAHVQTQPEQRTFPIYNVVWSPDGKQLLTASDDMSLKLWDATSGKLVREFKSFKEKDFPKGHHHQVYCGVFSKDGKLIASGSRDGMIKLWNTADGTVVREYANPNLKQLPSPESAIAHPGGVYGLRFSADDKFLISAGAAPKLQGYLAVWNVADGKMLYGREQTMGPIYGLAISKDGKQLLLGCGLRDRMMTASEAMIVPMPVP